MGSEEVNIFLIEIQNYVRQFSEYQFTLFIISF